VDRLTALLREVNGKRRQIEDDMACCEREADGDEPLRELAMLRYRVNQRRCAIRRQLDELVDSAGQPADARSWQPAAIMASCPRAGTMSTCVVRADGVARRGWQTALIALPVCRPDAQARYQGRRMPQYHQEYATRRVENDGTERAQKT
jgi:hypothetical protein